MLLTMPEFEMLTARSVDEACTLLSSHGDETRFLAGGTDLLTKMKLRRTRARTLIDINGIEGLDRIRVDSDRSLHIGAMATIQSIKESPLVDRYASMLTDVAGMLGTRQIRNLGTLGGNLANASPSAEFAAPLLVLDAVVQCATPGAIRYVPINEFFVAPGKCALRRGELITEVSLPSLPAGARAVYLKHSLRRMDVAIVGVAVYVAMEADVCREARIALSAVAPTPFRTRTAETLLLNRRLGAGSSNEDVLEEVARAASEEARPIDDLRSQAAQRREIVARLVKRCIERAVSASNGERESYPT